MWGGPSVCLGLGQPQTLQRPSPLSPARRAPCLGLSLGWARHSSAPPPGCLLPTPPLQTPPPSGLLVTRPRPHTAGPSPQGPASCSDCRGAGRPQLQTPTGHSRMPAANPTVSSRLPCPVCGAWGGGWSRDAAHALTCFTARGSHFPALPHGPAEQPPYSSWSPTPTRSLGAQAESRIGLPQPPRTCPWGHTGIRAQASRVGPQRAGDAQASCWVGAEATPSWPWSGVLGDGDQPCPVSGPWAHRSPQAWTAPHTRTRASECPLRHGRVRASE